MTLIAGAARAVPAFMKLATRSAVRRSETRAGLLRSSERHRESNPISCRRRRRYAYSHGDSFNRIPLIHLFEKLEPFGRPQVHHGRFCPPLMPRASIRGEGPKDNSKQLKSNFETRTQLRFKNTFIRRNRNFSKCLNFATAAAPPVLWEQLTLKECTDKAGKRHLRSGERGLLFGLESQAAEEVEAIVRQEAFVRRQYRLHDLKRAGKTNEI